MSQDFIFSIEFQDFLDPTLPEKVFSSLKKRAGELGVTLTRDHRGSSGTFVISSSPFFLSEEYLNFDWGYIFHFAALRQRETELWSFYLYSPLGEFGPGEGGEVAKLSDSSGHWADGGAPSGVSFSPPNRGKLKEPLFAWLPVMKNPKEAKPALFLDRDGILNRDQGHVYRIEDLEWKEDIFEVLQAAQARNYQLVVLTNQSGVARGYYELKDMEKLHQHMAQFLEKRVGVKIAGWYSCPYHPKGSVQGLDCRSTLRKPMAGMPLRATFENNIDFSLSLMVGDKLTDRFQAVDMETYLLAGNYFEASEAKNYFSSRHWDNRAPYYCFEDFKEMTETLKNRTQGSRR